MRSRRQSTEPSATATAPPEVVVARQPILDSEQETVAYELLFRGSEAALSPLSASEGWTASLIVDALTEIGLEDLVGARQAFVNVSSDLLATVGGLPLGPERVVLELLEGSHRRDGDLLQMLERLSADGYVIALDDFVYSPDLAPLLELATLVKLDVLAHDEAALVEQIARVRPFGVTLVAEKVETQAEFERCRDLGCELFQGYFFARPRLLNGPGVPSHQLATLETLAALTAPGIPLEELEAVISRDVGLAYKLLRYVNSAFFSLKRRIDSVHDAVVVLGERNVRQWATVIAVAGASEGPRELVALALLRARLCEQLGAASHGPDADAFFTAGLFSVADALLDAPLPEVLARLPLSDAVNDALLHHTGPIGEALARVLAAERGELEAAPPAGSYARAASWADNAARALA